MRSQLLGFSCSMVSLLVGGTALAAPNLAVCQVLAHYFINAPANFISERGQQIEPGLWHTNSQFPNASCKIVYNQMSDLQIHAIECNINVGANLSAIQGAFGQMNSDVKGCILALPTASEWTEYSNDTSSHVFRSYSRAYSMTSSTGNEEVVVGFMQDGPNLPYYNYVHINFDFTPN